MTQVPFDISLCPSQQAEFEKQTGRTDSAEFFELWHRTIGTDLEPTGDAVALYGDTLPPGTTIDDWGVAHSPGSAAAMHMTRLHHPLKDAQRAEEIDSYPFPRLTSRSASRIRAQVAAVHDAGFAAVGGMSQTIWERAWAIRSMEELMMDMMIEDEKATVLLDRITEISLSQAEIYAEAGCDIIHLGDDIGMQSTPMMSVELWRHWLKPRLARVIGAAKAKNRETLIFYHSCGFVEPFIDDLLECGIEILNPVQPESMSFPSLYERYADRLSFWGTIGTQTTMPFGTEEDVKAAVRQNVSLCSPAGGLVIAPTHILEPEVPWENILALFNARREASL